MNLSNILNVGSGFKSKILYLFLLSSMFYSCSQTKHLKEDEQLLSRIKLKYEGRKVFQDELINLSQQKPNRRLLGVFKLYLGVYNLYYNKPNSKIRNNIGEPPVIYDSTLNEKSLALMKRYLNNRGHYDAEVSIEQKVRKKKVSLIYHIKPKPVYKIKVHDQHFEDAAIANIIIPNQTHPILRPGVPFDLELLNDERKAIEKKLKNKGYYKFSKDYVVFEADTNRDTREVKLKTRLKSKKRLDGTADSLVNINYETYSISKIFVRVNFKNQNAFQSRLDSINADSITFINLDLSKFKPEIIARSIYIRPGDMYRQDLQDLTYRNLSALRVFNYVSITYDDDPNSSSNQLIAYIDVNPKKQNSFTLLTEGTNNGGNLGVNGTISFQNNNTFKGAENLVVQVSGGLEAQQILTGNQNKVIDEFFPFNTFEFGPEISLEVPRFLLPGNASKLSQKGNPRTTFNSSFNLQQRPDYRRSVSKFYVSYSWKETPTKTHIIMPVDFSFIKLDPSEEFRQVLKNINNPFLRNSYTDNFILASRYSFILNTQNENQYKNHYFFRGNIELAGNTISALSKNSNIAVENEGHKEIAGIRFAQYVRSDIDFRFYQNQEYSQWVYRFASGIGLPYGNSNAMPFEKSFYAGGANDIRAWRARQLGPGNLPDSLSTAVDQIGNMSITGNIEFRFDITKILEGAAFIDAGNIWNLDQEDSRPDTQFEFGKLWKGTAIGAGIGLRLNFSFFIFRFDLATPIKDPALAKPEQIKAQWNKSNLNFGIGYPF